MSAGREECLEAKRQALRYLPNARSLLKASDEHPFASETSLETILRGNIHAVGLGRKMVESKLTHERCVRIYVSLKLPKRQLDKKFLLPETIDGVPIDVIQAPIPWLAASEPERRRYDRSVWDLVVPISK